ncbi:MAG: ribonuclease Z [Candidatus Zixiibacteriota bacterium]
MRLTVIGCASGTPSVSRAHSCYLIHEGDRGYMLDCGDGAASALVRCGIDTSQIGDVFISHTHPDHVIGLPMLIQMEHLKKRSEPLRIHVPLEFERTFADMLLGLYLFPEKMCFEISVLTIDDDFVFDDGGVRIEVSPNAHLAGNTKFVESVGARNLMRCYSFALTTDGRKFAYSSDITGISDLDEIAENADLLLTEGLHVDLADLPGLLAEKGVKRCILTHLPDDFDRESTLQFFEKSGYDSLGFAQERLTVSI